MIALYVIAALVALLVLANLVLGRLPRRPDGGGGVVETANGGLHYLEQMGEGPTIVFVHGMPGIRREFDAMRAELPGRHTIAFDRPGYNWSTGDPLPFGDQIDSIAEASRMLGIDRAVVVGHSFGGLVALGLAIRHADFVESLLLLAPAAGGTRVGEDRMKQARLVLKLERPVIRQVADLLFLRIVRKFAARQGALVSYGSAPELAVQRHLAESVLARHNSIRALMNDRLLFNDAERMITKNLKRVTAPSIVLHGRQDGTVLEKGAVRLADALPNNRLELTEGDHQLPTKNAQQAVAALNELLGSGPQ
jgi:pimeloyl-ACP methyl ester carboxylesterase